MPTYGYRCTQCEQELEVMQRMSDAPLTTCPNCGGQLQKLLYPVGVQFKGSGFYTTDYKAGANGSKAAPGSSKESSNGGSSSESSSEKKSESGAKTEASTASSGSGDSSKKGD
jgi:putative FmdB family regulatory protein